MCLLSVRPSYQTGPDQTGPPIVCPSAHLGWTGPDQAVCACVANVLFISVAIFSSYCPRVCPPIWAGIEPVCPSGLDRTPVAAMSELPWHQWTELRLQQLHLCYKLGFNNFLAALDSDEEDVSDSDGEDALGYSPSPPWVLKAACKWASFAHRLLLRQEYRDQLYMAHKTWQGRYKHYELHKYGCHLRALEEGRHPLNAVDKLTYLTGPPY